MSELVVHEYGDPAAPPVVLLHGLTDAGTTWPDLVRHWASTWHVLAPDLRGHGASPRFAEDELSRTHAVMVADVVALLDALPAPAALIGHSLGGNLALHAALARPERVRALVLEDPAKPGDVPHMAPEIAAANEAMLAAVAADRAGEVARMTRETPWSAAEIEAWADSKLLVDREYVRRGLSLGGPAWEDLFDALSCPTLLVLPVDAEMAPDPDRVPNPLVTRVAVPGAGHCVRRDRPADYHRAVDAFLASLR